MLTHCPSIGASSVFPRLIPRPIFCCISLGDVTPGGGGGGGGGAGGGGDGDGGFHWHVKGCDS